MGWVRQKIAYKIVQRNRKSFWDICDRLRACKKSRGKVLKYQKGKVVKSPNGLCECQNTCCAGIHAYMKYEEAIEVADKAWRRPYVIIRVKGRWWRANPRTENIRAMEVEVLG